MTADTLDELVLPEKLEEWNSTTKHIWFADSSPRGQKTPGYLKQEFSTTNGKFIGLRSWFYIVIQPMVLNYIVAII